ncbi:MAG: cytochrome P460 family protein [Bacteroidia bacterium]|jgi:hypothetical protein|nr:cytochrome P460 family protein [Bacteroidia bacterium]
MKTKQFITLIFFTVFASAILFSCKKDEKEETPAPAPSPSPNAEFVADTNSFLSYSTWTIQATKFGKDPALGAAHGGNDSTVTRQVHFKDGQSPVNGKYPVGTIIVKHSTNTGNTLNEVTAMVKRGNNFNPTLGDWEFFMLQPDGKIAKDANGVFMRGANLMNGMCGGCHAGAAAKDFIYSK